MSVEEDVATVLALEAPAKELLTALKEAAPALDRLCQASYPGAGDVSDSVVDEDLGQIARALELMRLAGGNQAAWDHHFYCGYLGMNLGRAAEEIIDRSDDDAKLRRVEALRQYVASKR